MSGEAGGGARGRVSAEQLEALLAFMEEHCDFAVGKQSVYSRYSASKLWRLLAERLNAAGASSGGARKSPDKWCRYWADIKYKARKKSAAAGALGELSAVEERLRAIVAGGGGGSERARVAGGDGDEHSDDGSLASGGAAPDELLAEAAMRQALAAEKQAEAVAQGVELLRQLVGVLQERLPLAHTHTTLDPLQHHRM